MKSKKYVTGIVMLILVLLLSGWASNSNQKSSDKMKMGDTHSSSAEVPKGLKEANNSIFKVGSQAVVKANHMEGMYGAKATIVGAYDTTAYAVTYTPTTKGPKVKNHKWVIESELSAK